MVEFYKYHGAGNDFVMIDNRDGKFNIQDAEKIKSLCHRRFGIGADGVIALRNHPNYDFEMEYANSDGSIGAMCGNGGRCAAHFAHYVLKITKDTKRVKFLAADGEHEAEILAGGKIKLKMLDIGEIGERSGLPFLHCGTTPHSVMFVENLDKFPVFETGRKIRYSHPEGTNVNFVEIAGNIVNVRTYERGVEDETLACGTGATSVAVICHELGKIKGNSCRIKMPGGELTVEFEYSSSSRQGLDKDKREYKNIWLTGPAVCVFKGEIK